MMSLLIICLLIAALLPLLAKIPVGIAMSKAGGYNNHYPREQQATLKDFGARALGAHLNSFESLIVFTAAIATALATQHTTTFVQSLAVIHIVARLFYHAFYLMNLATLRSSFWGISYLCSIFILGACIPI